MALNHPPLASHRLTVDLRALAANYRDLAARSAPAKTAAVVKADAYGLGIDRVVPALAEAGCTAFFVALPHEGVEVRRAAPEAEIFVFSGAFQEALGTFLEARLIPVLSSLEQIARWEAFLDAHGTRRPCAIHVDTGMNRQGLTVTEARAFAEKNARDHAVTPILVMSHLACADNPGHALNQRQLESFQGVAALFEGSDSSLANSAGIFLGGDYRFTMTRPGIALYGGNPTSDAANPMRPVVAAEARIVQVRRARAGETASYGATVTFARDSVIAVAGVGYADGFHRALSGSGVPLREAVPQGGMGAIGGRHVPVLGRVTMDFTLFDITDLPAGSVKEGDWIELFGKTIALDEAARAAGTISYELLTGLGHRAVRLYVD